MATLRELLLSIKVKVDKDAVKQTDVAFDNATKSAQKFETATAEALWPLKKIAAQLKENTKLAETLSKVMLQPGTIPGRARAPEAPSDRNARLARETLGLRDASHPAPPRPGQSLAAPDVSAFMAKPQTALEALKAKASSAMASAGAAVDKFNARFDGTAKAIFNARTAMAGFAIVIAGTAIGRFIGSVIEAGGALHDMAQRTRVSVETLQVWKAIATDAGVDGNSLEGVFRKLNKSMAAAARGAKLPAQSFKDLGVQLKDGDKLRPIEDVLIDTGAALAKMDDDAKATAIAVQLLGPTGMGLVPAFNKGADAVRRLSVEMRENVALNADEAARLDDVGDAFTRGTKKWEAFKSRAVVALLPLLEPIANAFERVSKWVLRMSKETEILHTILAMFTGIGLARVITMIGAWVARVGGARAAMMLLGNGLRAAAVAAAEFILPMLVIEDFLVFLAGGKSLFGRAFEEIFGAGGAKKARTEIIGFFDRVESVVTNQIVPALAGVRPILEGIGTIAGSVLLGALNLIGMALSDNKDKTMQLAHAFEQNMAPAVQRVADVIAALGRAILKIPGMSGVGFAIGGAADDIRKTGAEMANSGKEFGGRGDSLIQQFGSANAINALRGFKPNDTVPRAMTPARPPVPVPSGPSRGQATVNDNSKFTFEINVGANATPGATGRAIADQVDAVLRGNNRDKRQILMAVAG